MEEDNVRIVKDYDKLGTNIAWRTVTISRRLCVKSYLSDEG